MTSYEGITKILPLIEDETIKEKILKLCENNKTKMEYFPASASRHHSWKGGYADHIFEVMRFSVELFRLVKKYAQNISFNQDDVIIVSFVHDIDKLERYKETTDGWKIKKGIMWEIADGLLYPDESASVVLECAKAGLFLTKEQVEAVSHHHGFASNNLASVYSYDRGGVTTLSVLIHSADMLSACLFGEK